MLSCSYLALGDSYTIGEGVALDESFPYQTVQLLRKAGFQFNAPEIIARTGWTSADLLNDLNNKLLPAGYDVVSLLSGVNDQYQGKKISDYKANFKLLLQKAISLTDNKPFHVFVLSIPDWGQTPFALGREQLQISREIDEYNKINHDLAVQYKTHYISLKQDGQGLVDHGLLAPDMLHPSKKEYTRWANLVAAAIKNNIT